MQIQNGLGGIPEMGMLFVYNGTPYGTTYHHQSFVGTIIYWQLHHKH